MIEINIYTKFNYTKIKKQANIFFNQNYKWYNLKTVFVVNNDTYLISLRKNNIRICYWDISGDENNSTKKLIKNFLKENFSNKTIGVTIIGKCDIFDELTTINTIYL